jgi:hypothetical protein
VSVCNCSLLVHSVMALQLVSVHMVVSSGVVMLSIGVVSCPVVSVMVSVVLL